MRFSRREMAEQRRAAKWHARCSRPGCGKMRPAGQELCRACVARDAEPPTCLCGEPHPAHSDACADCSFLDQDDNFSGAVVSALRVLGGCASPDAIEEEAGLSRRQVLRACAKLLAVGRVTRRVEESMLGADPHSDAHGVLWTLVDARPARAVAG